MTEEPAFLQAIIADPEDDTPRLIYADWLDEHGQPERAEFIRLQCQLARPDQDYPRRRALEKREDHLLEYHRRTWLGELDEFCMPRSFRRGFPEVVVLEHDTLTREFLARAPELFPLAPLVELELCYGIHPADPTVFRALAGVPQLSHFRTLRVTYCASRPEPALLALLESPFWTNLRHLMLSEGCVPRTPALLDSIRLRCGDRVVPEWE
jgi:uncharacterized protein (TIGR02996 family)